MLLNVTLSIYSDLVETIFFRSKSKVYRLKRRFVFVYATLDNLKGLLCQLLLQMLGYWLLLINNRL
jgi:hypothetical protein